MSEALFRERFGARALGATMLQAEGVHAVPNELGERTYSHSFMAMPEDVDLISLNAAPQQRASNSPTSV